MSASVKVPFETRFSSAHSISSPELYREKSERTEMAPLETSGGFKSRSPHERRMPREIAVPRKLIINSIMASLQTARARAHAVIAWDKIPRFLAILAKPAQRLSDAFPRLFSCSRLFDFPAILHRWRYRTKQETHQSNEKFYRDLYIAIIHYRVTTIIWFLSYIDDYEQ